MEDEDFRGALKLILTLLLTGVVVIGVFLLFQERAECAVDRGEWRWIPPICGEYED